MAIEAEHSEARPEGSVYLRVLRNRTLLLLWSGQSVSIVGDNFFNLAVMWVIYTQSHSALQTSLIQVVWHLDRIIFSPLAGIFADRWDRKRIMVLTNALSAIVVGALAAVMFARSQAPSAIIFVAVFLLNSLNTFLGPAQASLMPEIVGRDLMATAGGLFTTVGNVASLVGSALAGVVVAAMGGAWAVVGDAVSFLVAALSVMLTRLPVRAIRTCSSAEEKRPSLVQEIRDGWRAIAGQPVVRVMVWLGMLINVASFLGPLYPALVIQRLHGTAAALGAIEAAGVIGGMIGGALAGGIERRLGAGRLLAAGWGLAGGCTLGQAVSHWLPLTAALEAAVTFGVTVGSVSVGALTQALIPENYRGRVWGITSSVAVMSIPISALIGGWLADIVGVAPLFTFGGAWMLGVAALAWSNRHVRTARI